MFILYDKDMNVKPLPQGVQPLDMNIASMEKERVTQRVEGVNGKINMGSTYQERSITLRMLLLAQDSQDSRLLRNEVYTLLGDEYFYAVDPYESGKRHKVTVVPSFMPERYNPKVAELEVPLEMSDLPFAESIGTTQIIERNGISADDELWGFGMGLIAEDESLKYTHTTNTFRIWNAGDKKVHPFHQDLIITIDNVQGSTSFLQLENKTNGSVFRVNDAVSNQTIKLDGPVVTSNGLQYFRKTNHQFIELEPGWNEFQVTGATSARVAFDFRFYYS